MKRVYWVSYGPCTMKSETLAIARQNARQISKSTLYPIDIVLDGDVIETLVPSVSKSGRVSFRTRKAVQF
jgi:hypothetical protein